MNARSYKIIFILLSFSALSILIVQGYWMRNFYIQKKEEFQRSVYSALEHVNLKLNEKKNLRAVQEKVMINKVNFKSRRDTRKKSMIHKVYVEKNNSDNHRNFDSTIIYSSNGPDENPDIGLQEISIYTDTPGAGPYKVMLSKKPDNELAVTNLDSARARLKTLIEQIPSNDAPEEKTKIQQAEKKKELDRLMDKMLMEIKVIDTDEHNTDSIQSTIKRALESKGIFIPFDFALKKIFRGQEEVLAMSPDFRKQDKMFVTDLSANKIFPTHDFLFVNFPGEDRLMFASIRNMMILSLAFTLFIISLFYFVIRLIQQQKKLTEIRNDFVNNMTHELKTPIATISLAVDAINNPMVKNNETMFSDYSRILKEENQKLNTHVERVLQMSLLEKGMLHLNKQHIDIIAIIDSVIKMYALRVKEKNAVVIFESSAKQIKINGDEEHLRSVFSNLLDNALKYSNENCRIVIDVKTSGNDVVIKIKDNGIGINKNHQEKIFDKFYRAQGGNLHDVKGFGLGLSYVRSIVDAHGGNIRVESDRGNGSEFTIILKKDE